MELSSKSGTIFCTFLEIFNKQFTKTEKLLILISQKFFNGSIAVGQKSQFYASLIWPQWILQDTLRSRINVQYGIIAQGIT